MLNLLLLFGSAAFVLPAMAQETPVSDDAAAVKESAAAGVHAEDTGDNAGTAAGAREAPNVDLKEVAPLPEAVPQSSSADQQKADAGPAVADDPVSPSETTAEQSPPETGTSVSTDDTWRFVILGSEVKPGVSTRLGWSPDAMIAGLTLPTPVLVINGAKPGLTLCLSAAVHGDELNGIEVVRRVMYDIDPQRLSGRVIGVPIVNLQGFQRHSRYLPDRRDLNRYFPGDKEGSLASRIAASFFEEVISHCHYLVDLHTGSAGRTNLPQVRADMSHPEVREFISGFDKMAVVNSSGSPGMLRMAALRRGIVAITMEIGTSRRVQEEGIETGVKSIFSVMKKLQMYSRGFTWGDPSPVYYESTWLRARIGGILFTRSELGAVVSEGDVLGAVTDPITNQVSEITAPMDGRIIGMALDQVVMPGYAVYHLGRVSTEESIIEAPEAEFPEGTEAGETAMESDPDDESDD